MSHWTTHTLDTTGQPIDKLLGQTWLVSNGAGSYAMGTVAGCNSARYHGLLIGSARPPVQRVMLLSQMLEQLELVQPEGCEVLEFSTCPFREQTTGDRIFSPNATAMLTQFERGLSVRWVYERSPIRFTRELLLHHGQAAATLRYTVEGLDALSGTDGLYLRLVPMLAMRDFHHLLHAGQTSPFDVQPHDTLDTVSVSHDNQAATLHCPQGAFHAQPGWWYGFVYANDAERGQEHGEDLFVPGRFDVALQPTAHQQIECTVALGRAAAAPLTDASTRANHLAPVVNVLQPLEDVHKQPKLAKMLAIAADDFVVERSYQGEKLATILAGYPWFADWGRDTFIALPGLLLSTRRFDEARAVLKAFAGAIDHGLVPNRFDDYDDAAAHYNTVDASLWFVHAALAYVQSSGDTQAWDAFLSDAVQSILNAYLEGTLFEIGCDPADGLIHAGGPDTQLTWMDAATGGVVFTPRFGKAVEINALWYNALCGVLAHAPDLSATTAKRYEKTARLVKKTFTRTFWHEEAGCLFDHIRQEDDGSLYKDASIRPNQVLAASLPYSPLAQARAKQMLKVVREKLLTPMGLRTLPVDDPHYHPWYVGDQFQRDEAYHQGTIWPWLIGPYAEAVLRTGKFSGKARKEAHEAIRPLLDVMAEQGTGQLHEIHEAATLRPVGCMAQAWSVSEVLRVLTLIAQAKP